MSDGATALSTEGYERALIAILWVVSKPTLSSQLNGSVKEPNKFHIYETEKIIRKASDAAEYIELFGSFTRDLRARRI